MNLYNVKLDDGSSLKVKGISFLDTVIEIYQYLEIEKGGSPATRIMEMKEIEYNG